MMALEEKFEITLDEEGKSTNRVLQSECQAAAFFKLFVVSYWKQKISVFRVWLHIQLHAPSSSARGWPMGHMTALQAQQCRPCVVECWRFATGGSHVGTGL